MSWIPGLPERIADKIVPEPNSGCWLWTGSGNGKGYGQVHWSGGNYRAHRLVYEMLRGPIPEGSHIDHLCRVRCCVNPDHLEPVTHQENVRRGSRTTMTHCLRGHPLSGRNVHIRPNGNRQCLECRRVTRRKTGVSNRDKTHCPHGHPYSGKNLSIRPDGSRRCLTCVRRTPQQKRLRKLRRLQAPRWFGRRDGGTEQRN